MNFDEWKTDLEARCQAHCGGRRLVWRFYTPTKSWRGYYLRNQYTKPEDGAEFQEDLTGTSERAKNLRSRLLKYANEMLPRGWRGWGSISVTAQEMFPEAAGHFTLDQYARLLEVWDWKVKMGGVQALVDYLQEKEEILGREFLKNSKGNPP